MSGCLPVCMPVCVWVSLFVCACQDCCPKMGVESIRKLLESVDEWIPTPARELDKPFLMPVEWTYSIPGRGTVVTGRVERGTMKKGDAAEFVGFKANTKTIITSDHRTRNIHPHTPHKFSFTHSPRTHARTHTHTHTLVGRSAGIQTTGGSR